AMAFAKGSAELIDEELGQYDVTTKTWHIRRQVWYRPGIPDRAQMDTYSAFGKVISSRTGDSIEGRPTYLPEGIEQSSQTFERDATSGQFDVLYRQEDDYHWENGRRSARVQIFSEGLLADEYRIITDAQGRIMEDGIRIWPQLQLKTALTYEADS